MRRLYLFLFSAWQVSSALANQIVRLERPELGATEPYFSPKSVNATVGEQIHFVAFFNQTTKVPCCSTSLTQNFVPFAWSFAESDYGSPCVYNQGIAIAHHRLIQGYFRGTFTWILLAPKMARHSRSPFKTRILTSFIW